MLQLLEIFGAVIWHALPIIPWTNILKTRKLSVGGSTSGKLLQDDKLIRGLMRAKKWREGGKQTFPFWAFAAFRDITIDVTPDGPLANDFATGKKKLVPIVFSHGLTANRSLYSTNARELSAHGFLVILLDHQDGTCSYTENKDGSKKVYFDIDTPFYEHDDMSAKTKIREKESKLVID